MGHYNIKVLILFLTLLLLAVLSGIFDLDISRGIVNQYSEWAKFFENYGMIPGILIILSGINIYYSYIKSRTNFWSYLQKVIFFLVSSGLTYYLFEILLDKVVSDNLITFLIISFSINLILFIILYKIKQVENETAIKYSKVVIGMALFGYVIGIQIIKFIWGRVRFRELDSMFSQFTPWYLPQGITGYDSFPSGHAAMGFILLSLLIPFTSQKIWLKYFLLLLILIFGIVLAFSRVVVGAHYASDVLFGSFIIVFTFITLRKNSKQ